MWPEDISFTGLGLNGISGCLQGVSPLIAGFSVLVTVLLGKCIKSHLLKRRLALKRKQKATACRKSIEKLQGELSHHGMLDGDKVDQITKLTLNELIVKLQNDQLTPVEVLEAYQSKALEVNNKTNCIVEPITEAKTDAENLSKAKKKGPLYGVPVSLKDNYGVEGYDCDVGIARWIDKPFSEDAVLVKVLKSQGAIPFVKTNVPQTMISFETTNPIHGETRNPHDKTRGVGGSSGGEGALIAGGGSYLGFGSDIGGSIRIPSSMCGVCGLKPTAHRLSPKGTTPLMKGQACIQAAYGPMSRDVGGLVTVMKALLVPEMYRLDATVPVMPFRDEIFESKRRLKIGYFVYDGYFRAVPAMERGVMEAKAILEQQGHELVEWTYPDISLTASAIWGKAIFGDGGEELQSLLAGDVCDSSSVLIVLGFALPDIIKRMLYHIIRPLYPKMARLLLFIRGQKTVTNWWKLVKETMEFRDAVVEDWQNKGLDAVLSPGLGSPALPFGDSVKATGVTSYTMLYNVLNFPSGSMPITKVTKDDNDKLVNYPTPNPWHSTVKKSMKGSEGLPVNIQVAALPWQEEVILRLMKEIEDGLQK